MGDYKMVGLRVLTLSLVLVLLPETAVSRRHLVQDVAKFLDQKIDFIGHDEGFRKHITALEEDLKTLEDSDVRNADIVTKLNMVHTVMKTVEDHVVNLARRSKTDVSGLQTSLGQFKRQVDRGLSTDSSYRSIMDHIGMLINHSSEIISEEIKEITKAEVKLNAAISELTRLRSEEYTREKEKESEGEEKLYKEGLGNLGQAVGLSLVSLLGDSLGYEQFAENLMKKSKEKLAAGVINSFEFIVDRLDQTEGNLKKSLDYFEKESVLIKNEDAEIRKLKRDFNEVKDNWYPDELEEIAKKDVDWEKDLMVYIRNLKSSVTRFVSNASNW